MTVPMTRRRFLAMSARTVALGAVGGVAGYSLLEGRDLNVHPVTIPLERLPAAFNGLRIALLTDLHHGYFIPRDYIASAVEQTNSLGADLILLGGDYIHDDAAYIAPVMEELSALHASHGVFAVQGNRDRWVNGMLVSEELARNGIGELTNRGLWLQRGESRIWLCGIDDCNEGKPDAIEALNGASRDALVLAMTHNPRYADSLKDTRIGLILSGHTHGGQVNLPLFGRPFLPQGCEKYPCGLIPGAHHQVFVSTGIGSIFPPVRFNCPPEIALLTLTSV